MSASPQRRPVVIDIPVAEVPFRRALKDALSRAVTGQPGGPWRIRLARAPLGRLGRAPSVGHWWWSLRLTGADGRPHALLVGLRDQNPAFLECLVRNALQGECFSEAPQAS